MHKLKICVFFCLIVLMLSSCHRLFGPKTWNVKDGQAIGDGIADDTEAIQAIIKKASRGDTILVPEGVYRVRTLILKSKVHMVGEGLLKQQVKGETEKFTNNAQNSKRPLLKCEKISNVFISVNAESQHEAIRLIGCKNIDIQHANLKGDSTKLRSFAGILIYDGKNINIRHTTIRNYGTGRLHTHSYQPGTGIRILGSEHINIAKSSFVRNGENGVFIHGSANVDVKDCHFSENGMSAIQVAFGSEGVEKNYTFENNTMEHNAADAIDINNRSPSAYLDINCLIKNNLARNNGFVNGQSTPDGSGIATLINVSGVKIIDNIAEDNNRPAIYLESCGSIYATGNTADNQVEIVKELEDATFYDNSFGSIYLLANVEAKKITVENNKLRVIHLPNDIKVDSLLIQNNAFSAANFNFNLHGKAWLTGNQIQNKGERVTIMVNNMDSMYIGNNDIYSEKSNAILIKHSSKHTAIVDNRIEASNACIQDEGSHRLLISGNTLTSLAHGSSRHTVLSFQPDQLRLIKNKHKGARGSTAILLSGTGTAHLESEEVLEGKTDFGKVEVRCIDLDCQ
ncbi:MAG: right-handed parallel beta-helix repeat-containing protein [Cyclobacteriaceae bacterium]